MTFESICTRDFLRPEDHDTHGSHILPIHQTSTFIYPGSEEAMAVFRGEKEAYIYSRWGNPTVDAVERKLCALETYGLTDDQGNPLQARALLYSTGMAAISSMLLATLQPGDVILTSGNVYGTTVELMNVPLQEHGIQTLFTDLGDLDSVSRILQQEPAIKLLYIESPTNPTVRVYDLAALTQLAHAHGARVAVDNTFSSPYLQQPFRWGVDFVLHSTTKYLNGHGTALGGVWIGRDIPFMESRGWQMRKLFGGTSNALEAWLLNNGLKTLPLRMRQHCENASELAEWLAAHPAVTAVHYPGLTTHPDHELATLQMRLPGGMVSFELKGGLQAGIKCMNAIRFCQLTSSLGTADTLITHPASMTHVKVPVEQRQSYGITDGLIRMSVGLENVEDIREDLEQALAGL